MTIRDLALEGIEQSINGLLALDPVALQRLARLHGRCVGLQLDGIGLTLYFVPGHDGRLQLLGSIEGEPDCTLSGSPLDLVRAGDEDHGHAQLFAGNVRIDGDTALAQRFSEALAGLDIDWEEQLSRLTGDIAAHEIGRGVRAAARQGERMRDVTAANLSEYLTEEARLLPHPFEVDQFLTDVDTLRDDVARLEARIALLEKAGPGDPQ
ncbi:MAG: SCP2 sterol-binding domain-containing protein [Gammaproteobacteria bacterium]|nr:SCP2 sterol-binding domain-containing protein [Gammaproteobacteria bacterium]